MSITHWVILGIVASIISLVVLTLRIVLRNPGFAPAIGGPPGYLLLFLGGVGGLALFIWLGASQDAQTKPITALIALFGSIAAISAYRKRRDERQGGGSIEPTEKSSSQFDDE